jgi:hypothetical protein
MKRDLLQGLLTYPASIHDRSKSKSPAKNRKFFQMVTTKPAASRLSRRKSITPVPRIIQPDRREAIWRNLRKDKNV